MRVTVGQLRCLIREALLTERTALDPKTHQLVQQVVDAAEGYVGSVVAGSPDKQSAAQLQHNAEQVASYAKWMLSRREPRSEPVAMVAKYALDLAELSGFWKRPSFLNRDEHVEELQQLLRKLQRKQIEALS